MNKILTKIKLALRALEARGGEGNLDSKPKNH
jgi:hypothetical protein